MLFTLGFYLCCSNLSWATPLDRKVFPDISEGVKVVKVFAGKKAVMVEVTVTGTVVDNAGQPVPGVTISVPGTTIGTATDLDGRYSLSVPEGSTLVFSFIGFETQKIEVGDQSVIDITLSEDMASLDEVVVIGYGTVKKSDLTGSVSTIEPERLLDRPAVNVGQALTGKIPGVEVFNNSGRPDGQIKIRIRGNNSITASNEPLYVIDGVIGVADINLLNPNNIESLEVLKDASATAIYGARGANGVILITTKKGVNSTQGIIAYDGYTSFGVMAKKQNIEFLNASEWWQVYNTGFDNIEKYDPIGYAQGKFQRVSPEDLPNLFDSAGNPIYDTDWENETYRTAISQNHQVSFSGGNDKTTHRVYLGYLRQEALMDKNYLERYNGQFNVDSKLRNWLKAGANVSLNYNIGNELYGNYRLKRLAQEALPLIPLKYPGGAWGSNRDFPGAVQDTPSRYLEEMVDETTNAQIISNFYLDFKITKDLDFKSTFAVDIKNRKNNFYVGKNLIQFGGKNNGGIAQISTESQVYWQNENYFNWNKQLNENNNLNLMLGLSWQQRSAELLGAEHRNFIDDFYQWHNLGAGTVNQPSSSNDWSWSLNSYFARANYNISNKYLFTATGRYDGSSKFGKNNKYAFFPSVAFAWRLSEEDFLKGNNLIDNLKIRTSIGKTGNQEIANYAYSQNLGSSNVIFVDEFYSALYRSSFGNPDLKWETTTQRDAGVDISFLQGRVDMTFDYYHKITSDLLLNAPIPYTSGLSSVMQNIGSVRNQGFEAALNSYNIMTEDFSWTTTLAFATNKNKIIKLGANNEDIFPTRHATGDMQILRVGEPVGSFWGLTRLGTWSTDEADEAAEYNRLPGDLKYADINNDGKIDENDNSVIGRSTPDWTMGISNTFTYRNIDLSFDIRMVQGIDVMNAGTHTREDRSGVANGSKTILNAWTPTNQNTMIAELRYMKTYYDSYPDTHWLQDGSFVRLQNFSIGYTFDESILNKIGLQKSRIYASGQNLFLLTDYKGYDPEVSTHGSAFGQGIDDFGEPRARTYTIGLNINF
jgi:TonB-linked SusC/RagA family outer membrane protein